MTQRDTSDDGYRLSDDPAFKELRDIQDWLARGDLEHLTLASQVVNGFPQDRDSLFGTPWIVHAVTSGCFKSVAWMIEQGVDLMPSATDGYPPLLACIENGGNEKYQILETLLAAGADINERGINGWTPLHMAAMRDDQTAMRILLLAGADRGLTTLVDDNATAEDEARNLGHFESAEFIASFSYD